MESFRQAVSLYIYIYAWQGEKCERTGKLIIMRIRQLIIQKDTRGIMLGQALRYLLAVFGIVHFDSWPSEPVETG